MSRAPHSAAEDVNLESHCPTGPECSLLAARKERSLRFDGGKAGCNYCLTFQRVSDYALPRSGDLLAPSFSTFLEPPGSHGFLQTGGACIIEACTASFVLCGTNNFVLVMMQTPLPAIPCTT